jgi:predicted signal transduction protein with EAL and GGDEF domain
VLREVAHRLQGAVRTADTVARLGGDEFAILIEQSLRPLDEAGTVAERVLQSLTTPIQVTGQRIVLSASIGITVSDPGSTASSMLRDADIAMYRAKSTGKSKVTVYDPQMRAAAIERLELQTDLITALADQEFRLVYQPIIELDTDTIVGFEALLRWDHPTRGTLPPDTFIGLTEESGAITEIGAWVLTQACHTAATWQAHQPDQPLTMAVNLSPRQIATPDIIDHVTTALAGSGFPAGQLILELTENILVEDAPTAAQRLHELHELHVRLAIDDFGTGYSSLSYLRQFPVDILKIDRSFTHSITDQDHLPAIIRGLLDLGKTLQLETVAEGIEHPIQRDSLRDQHCDYGQGFLFAKPLTHDQALAYLLANRRTCSPAQGTR